MGKRKRSKEAVKKRTKVRKGTKKLKIESDQNYTSSSSVSVCSVTKGSPSGTVLSQSSSGPSIGCLEHSEGNISCANSEGTYAGACLNTSQLSQGSDISSHDTSFSSNSSSSNQIRSLSKKIKKTKEDPLQEGFRLWQQYKRKTALLEQAMSYDCHDRCNTTLPLCRKY